MTDEEKAEEYVIETVCGYCNRCETKGYVGCDTYRLSKKAYLDGLAEGRKEKWHDLRKNPNNLPKEHKEYWTKWDDGAYSTAYYFGDGFGTYVIAWCELPKFKE